VMRAFEDDDVIHAEDTVDPIRDIDTISSELRIKDLSDLESVISNHMKKKTAEATKTPQSKKRWEENLASYEKIKKWMEDGKDVRNGMDIWSNQDVDVLNELQLTAKPVLFAVNMNIEDYKRKKNKFLKKIFDWVQANAPGATIIPYCGAFENDLIELDAAATEEKFKELEVKSALPISSKRRSPWSTCFSSTPRVPTR